ncbi:MAG: PTS sugar transporter subunit IIA [Spirochaetia bacterium]|nr:PTS sugar transporter subunit IIA [Spirochaetia bacterium]
MLLSFYLKPEACITHIDCTTKNGVIEHLVNHLTTLEPSLHREEILAEVLEREAQYPTYIGFNCAIPHAQISSLTQTYVVAASCKKRIPFTEQGEKVSLVVLIIGPKTHSSLHLRLLSSVARILHKEERRTALEEAKTSKEFYNIFCSIGE